MAAELPQSMAQLLSEIDDEWRKLLDVVGRLSPEQMARPDSGGWSPKDNLAHLEAWLRCLNASYLGGQPEHEAMGIEAAAYARLDTDGVNAVLFTRNRDRTTDYVLQGLRDGYAEALKTIRARAFADLLKPVHEDDPERRTILQEILANTSEHFSQHRLTIEKLL